MTLRDNNAYRRLVAPWLTKGRRHAALLAAVRRSRGLLNGPGVAKWALGPEQVGDYQVDFRAMVPQGFSDGILLIASPASGIVPAFHRALEMLGVAGRVIDPVRDDFHQRVSEATERLILCRPSHDTNLQRQMFWEKALPLYDMADRAVFPSPVALRLYEAKRELAYFLRMHRIPHPETHVFHDMDEALEFARTCRLPQVFKTNTGAGGGGVEILRSRQALVSMVREIFLRHYVKRSMLDYRDIDYGYVILQEYVSPVREYRVIKIGESWFGHEKLPGAQSELMSGSGMNAWTPPPHDLLDFCHDLAERFGFTTMCFDIFRSGEGPYLVNELQTWFGSYDNSQMYLDGVPGRYVRTGDGWIFEAGYFNQVRSFPLIISSIIQASNVSKGVP